ncbi:MAG: hypothetical protein ACE5ET_07560, partial [Gammaproteobacteria bacterium]
MPHRHAVILLLLIAAGVLAGGAAGWIWGPAMHSVAWLGDLFLTALSELQVYPPQVLTPRHIRW